MAKTEEKEKYHFFSIDGNKFPGFHLFRAFSGVGASSSSFFFVRNIRLTLADVSTPFQRLFVLCGIEHVGRMPPETADSNDANPQGTHRTRTHNSNTTTHRSAKRILNGTICLRAFASSAERHAHPPT